MKKNILLTAVILTALLSSSVGFAKQVSEKERMGALANFVIMGVVGASVQATGKAAQLSPAATATLHTANVLYSVGQLTDKPVFRDLGLRALVAGGSAKLASSQYVNQGLPFVPLVGESMAKSGGYGVGIVTVTLYKSFGAGYDYLLEKTGMDDFLGLK